MECSAPAALPMDENAQPQVIFVAILALVSFHLMGNGRNGAFPLSQWASIRQTQTARRGARFFWRRSLARPLALWPLSSFASRLLSFLLRIIASTRVAGCSPRRAWLKILMMWCVSPHLYFHKADQSGNIAAVAFWSTDTQTFNEYDKAEQKSI